MAINGIVIPKRVLSMLGGTVEVRGLSYEDVSRLLTRHEAAIRAVYDAVMEKVVKAPESASGDAVVGVIQTAIAQFPDLIADAVALAADEPDMVDEIRKWPAEALLAVAVEVADLTFASEVDVERMVGTLQALMARMPEASPAAGGSRSTSGDGGSGKNGPASFPKGIAPPESYQ